MTESTTTRLLVVALAVALVGAVFAGGVVFGQQTEDDVNQQVAYLRVVHASPDAPAVDLYVDNETALTNVPFGAVSEYAALSPGEHDITITTAGNASDVVFEGTVDLNARSVSTLAATGEVSTDPATFGVSVYPDNAFTPGEDQSAISVIHLSPDAPAVDVTADNGSVTLADDVSYQNASDYVSVPAGNYTVEIREESEGDNGTVVDTANVTLEGGTAYTALAVGYLNPNESAGNQSFQIGLTEDASLTLQLPQEEIPQTPAATETPEATETPAATETPGATETPVVTETPEATETPEETETPVETETETVTPEATETPAETETETAEEA